MQCLHNAFICGVAWSSILLCSNARGVLTDVAASACSQRLALSFRNLSMNNQVRTLAPSPVHVTAFVITAHEVVEE